MFDGRKLQFFCSQAQLNAAASLEAPFGLTGAPSPHFEEFEVACAKDSDCPMIDKGQLCTLILWDGSQDGTSYANGSACYNWNEAICPGPDFAQQNMNYEGTKFSYYTEYKCASSSAFALAASAFATLASLSILV